MDRKEFLKTTILGAAALAVSPVLAGCVSASDKKSGKTKNPELKISFQEKTAPGETLAQKLDWMEAHGVVGFEPWGTKLWERVDEYKSLLAGRSITMSAICAGYDGFILAEDPAVKAAFDESMRRIIVAAGELGSMGVIMVPAFNWNNPCRPHTAGTREFLVEQLAGLGEWALQHGTSVILEPLNRKEAFYLRQVADAASICRDTGSEGVRCLGDFWHMGPEETSDYGAFMSAGSYLKHVHIASRGNRLMPGEDGAVDNYVDGFRALKELGYEGQITFECDTRGDREVTVPAALELLRSQWKEA